MLFVYISIDSRAIHIPLSSPTLFFTRFKSSMQPKQVFFSCLLHALASVFWQFLFGAQFETTTTLHP